MWQSELHRSLWSHHPLNCCRCSLTLRSQLHGIHRISSPRLVLGSPSKQVLNNVCSLVNLLWQTAMVKHCPLPFVFQGAAHRRDPLLSTGFRSELQTPPLFTHEKARHRPPIPILCLKNDWLNCWSPLTNLDKTSANVTSFTRFSESRQPLKLSSGTGTTGKAVLMESTDLRAKHCLIPSDHGLCEEPT